MSRLAVGLLAVAAAAAASCGGSSGPGGPAPPDPGRPDPARVPIPAVQGASHVSPMLGDRVEVTGVVTAVGPEGVFLQDPDGDGDPATSDALVVTGAGGAAPGDRIRAVGRVDERVPGGAETENLSTTVLRASEVESLASGRPLPGPVRLGEEGRLPPEEIVISADELPVDLRDPDQAAATPFEPETEGLDFYESLEAMRVTVVRPVAVSPVDRFEDGGAELYTLAERGARVTPDDARTFRGGIRLATDADNRGDHNPERIQLQAVPGLTPGEVPDAAVGAELADVTGVVGYGFGSFEVMATTRIEVTRPAGLEPGTTSLAAGTGRVTVATYNVLNLNPLPENEERMARLGRHVARGLGAPDVVALQEIQDENGTRGGEGSEVTDAAATLRALTDAVAAAGGPRYEFADVAPEPNSSGGVPGGNIRNAFLWRPDRVELRELASLDRAELQAAGVRDPAAFEGSRDPLAATFALGGRRFTVVNNHFSSRAGSSPVFGARQPFVQAGEAEREAQSRAVHDWVARRLEERPGAGVVVVGDLNTFEFTDDLTRLLPGPDGILENLVLEVPADRRYSYVFRGNAQVLDHLFVTGGLADGAVAEPVHLNADLPEGRAASDHDPVVAEIPVP